RNAFAHQRHAEHGPPTSEPLRFRLTILRVSQDVGNVNHPPFKCYSPNNRIPSGLELPLLHVIFILSRKSAASSKFISRTSASEYVRALRFAQMCCRLYKSVEHRLQIESRAADDF